MKILIAPNAFKGSLTAAQAADIISRSLPEKWERKLCPIADGGDGTLDCLVAATGGRYFEANVRGPLPGMDVRARWGALGSEKTGVVEMAEAAGIRLLNPEQRSAGRTTTYGVGQLILNAIDAGFRKILVGLGGSATNDGGSGCAEALGIRFLDRNGNRITEGGINLRDLQTIELSEMDKRVQECQIICLADVNNILLGPAGATRMFGRQKGATDEEIESLENAMGHYSDVLREQVLADVARIPGGGAAGGFGAGLIAFCNARIVSGIDYILGLLQFDQKLHECDAVVTAEGRVDEQTVRGKAIAGIARRAGRLNKPVHVFAGRVEGDPQILSRQLGVGSIHEISPTTMDDREAMNRAAELLGAAVKKAAAGW